MANNYQNFQFNPQSINQPLSNFSNQNNQPYPGQIVFPQIAGNVYNLNNSSEIGNIPYGNNISVGLCLSENLLYIKSLQNGGPVILGYKLTPINEFSSQKDSNDTGANKTEEILKLLEKNEKRFGAIEKQIAKIKEKIGGTSEWQI